MVVNFTPGSSFAGGVLIGLAAAMLVLLNGRVAGISGIVGGLFRPAAGDISWRIAFVLGLLVSPAVLALVRRPVFPHIEAGWLTLIVAGLLVGLGTSYASGCTSGHGVCGLSRLSPRSLVATGVFMAAGMLTVLFTR